MRSNEIQRPRNKDRNKPVLNPKTQFKKKRISMSLKNKFGRGDPRDSLMLKSQGK